jgi:ABC-2 type transport system ATP-binding protein
MIDIQKLSKNYGLFEAIQNISFSVGSGEVVGFLGPNGAGKSTTMRILCGCIGATSGSASINGLDVSEHPMEVKKHIGYLPETPPLYPNMVVNDYLEFCASIKGVRDPVSAADTVIKTVGLGDVKDRIIENLSKGFRQRVGIAQALIHNPSVLVLDEPTSGLDPEQRKEIRDLLRQLAAGNRTVILSTHVLSEIEAICERVIIIAKGQVVYADRLDSIRSHTRKMRIQLVKIGEDTTKRLEAIPEVTTVECLDESTLTVTCTSDIRTLLAKTVVEDGLLEMSPAEKLEDVYLRLTSSNI